MSISVWVYALVNVGILGVQKRVEDATELEIRGTVGCSRWVLQTSAKAVPVSKC